MERSKETRKKKIIGTGASGIAIRTILMGKWGTFRCSECTALQSAVNALQSAVNVCIHCSKKPSAAQRPEL